MASESERRLLEALAADSDNSFTSADAEALAGIPIWCILRCAAQLVTCGPTNPECQREFIDCVVGCVTG